MGLIFCNYEQENEKVKTQGLVCMHPFEKWQIHFQPILGIFHEFRRRLSEKRRWRLYFSGKISEKYLKNIHPCAQLELRYHHKFMKISGISV